MKKGLKIFLTAIAVIVVLAIILLLPPVQKKVSDTLKIGSEKLRMIAATAVAAGLGVLLITWGIAALAMPILGGAMIVIGLVLIAYAVWPLFRPGTQSDTLGIRSLQSVA